MRFTILSTPQSKSSTNLLGSQAASAWMLSTLAFNTRPYGNS